MTNRTLGTVTNDIANAAPSAGSYLVELEDIQEEESQFDENGQWRWIYKIRQVVYSADDDAEDFVGKELWGFSSRGLGPMHKARAWIEALLQRQLTPGEAVDLDELIGKQAIANVVPHTKRDGTETTKLGNLQPYKKTRPTSEVDRDDCDEDAPF